MNEERARARDPNTPLDELQYLAHYFPEDVRDNPVIALYSIEDPKGWLTLQQSINAKLDEFKLREGLSLAAQRVRNLFAADCIELRLALIEKGTDRSPIYSYYYEPMIKAAKNMISQLRLSPDGAAVRGRAPSWVDGDQTVTQLPMELESLAEFINCAGGGATALELFTLAQSAEHLSPDTSKARQRRDPIIKRAIE